MKSKRKKSGFDSRRKRESFLFLIPWMLGAVFMLLIPVMFQLAISFSEITNVRTMTLEFVGLSHYHRAILVDTGVVPYTLQVIGETLLHAPLNYGCNGAGNPAGVGYLLYIAALVYSKH